jgi:uncharacterized protein YndB with AHSA1/START domain
MNNERFVYVTYIATTPAKVWAALVEGEITRRYWGHANVSDWKPGSRWEHVADDAQRTVKLTGTVVEAVPGQRLVLTWGEGGEHADPAHPSRVAIDIETVGKMVRLTVTHDQLAAGSDMVRKISIGWPRVLSSLKSLIETGTPLDTWA